MKVEQYNRCLFKHFDTFLRKTYPTKPGLDYNKPGSCSSTITRKKTSGSIGTTASDPLIACRKGHPKEFRGNILVAFRLTCSRLAVYDHLNASLLLHIQNSHVSDAGWLFLVM